MEAVNTQMTDKAIRDYKLVCLAREKGDEKAYADLLRIYREPLYLMLLKMTNDPVEADDLTIEAFGKAFRSLHLYTPTHAFSTWLFSIASNNCIDFIRKKRLQTISIHNVCADLEDGQNDLPIASSNPTPEEEFITTQRVKIMHEVVQMLKPRYRRLVELRYFEEMSYEEISEELGLPLGTVKAQLYRARDLLYNILKDRKDLI
ncbi:MAG: sigma-70 family RNA polymerase sigma factor [Bacteroidales bacterium]|nr:sigma-70 family RNA polymerase sigma factor [Bacteroidales bacterium]